MSISVSGGSGDGTPGASAYDEAVAEGFAGSRAEWLASLAVTVGPDLTAIEALTPADDDVVQRKAGAWTNRTPAQLKTDLALDNVANTAPAGLPISTATQTALDGKQPIDSDLTALAALAPADDTVVQRKAGAWVARSPAQLKTDLALGKADVGLGNVDNTADTAKPVSTAQQTALNAKLTAASNLSDLANAGTARTNLGLGSAATLTAGAANGAATLGSDGYIPSAQIPAIAISEFLGDAASQAAMLALPGQKGDWATRSDGGGSTWIISGTDPTQLGSWTQITTPTDAVTSVNGNAGVVVLVKADVGLGNVDNTADTAKPVSTAQATADALKLAKASNLSDLASASTARTNLGLADAATTTLATERAATATLTNKTLTSPVISSPTGLVKADVGLGNVDNTADTAKPVSTAQQTALNAKQDADSDLTALAAIAPANDDFIQRKAGAWTNRTPAQALADLGVSSPTFVSSFKWGVDFG